MKWLVANAGSIGMSLFLAILTWIYLWSEASSTRELTLPFTPVVRAGRIARLEYEFNGKPFRAEEKVTVVFSGPRAQIDAIERGAPRCAPTFEEDLFTAATGAFSVGLKREDFGQPDSVRIVGKALLNVRYVKRVEMEVPIVVTGANKDLRIEGRAMVGFRVKEILPRPDKVKILAPADQDFSSGIPIENARVSGQRTTFTAPGRLKLPPGVERLSDFSLDVVIGATLDRRTFAGIPIHLVGAEDVVRRLKIESPTVVDISVSGPREVLDKLFPADFTAYAEADLAPAELEAGAKRTLKILRCHLKQKVEGDIDITVMYQVKPEDRQVEVRVLPAR